MQGVSLGSRKRFSRESFSASAQANTGNPTQRNNLAPQYSQACYSELDVSSKRPRDKRKEIRSKLKLDKWESSTASSEKTGCRWTFVFDPAGRLCYYWSMVVSLAFLYNFWVLIYRFAFQVSFIFSILKYNATYCSPFQIPPPPHTSTQSLSISYHNFEIEQHSFVLHSSCLK